MKKNKKIIIFAIVCIVIVVACVVVQILLNKDTKKLEEESKKFETLITQTKSGETIETEYIHIEDNKFYIKVPKKFKQLDYETITKKYQGDIPKVVFSNEETTINLAISITNNELKNNQIKSFKEQMENVLKGNSEILETNYYEVDNHNIAKIKLISKGTDTDIYNNMICFSYNDKQVIITFNCTKELQEEWQEVGDFIIDSLFIKE